MTIADTVVDATDTVDRRLLPGLSSDTPLPSEGQPMECAKFSMDGVTGLLWLASTRSRRLEARRVLLLGVGDAVSTTVTAGSDTFRGDSFRGEVFRGEVDSGLRFLRTVTFCIRSMFHSRSGISSTVGDPLSSTAPAVVSTLSAAGKYGPGLLVGVTSFSSCSNASPSPLSSSTVLSLSTAIAGVADLLSPKSEEERSSRAVLNDSALDEGYGNRGGRSRVPLEPEAEPFVRGGLGSGVGGLRALTGVLSDDFFDMREFTTLSACARGGGSTSSADCPS
jgi:hypothetical protein